LPKTVDQTLEAELNKVRSDEHTVDLEIRRLQERQRNLIHHRTSLENALDAWKQERETKR
jgi:hypothetical protein